MISRSFPFLVPDLVIDAQGRKAPLVAALPIRPDQGG